MDCEMCQNPEADPVVVDQNYETYLCSACTQALRKEAQVEVMIES